MIRRIIAIDEAKCNGCGLCEKACHEGAIKVIDGKAKLVREDFCDGLGDCLPNCPKKAISFEEREALSYNEALVESAKKNREEKLARSSSIAGKIGKGPIKRINEMNLRKEKEPVQCSVSNSLNSSLANWPIQIKLTPVKAPYFENCNLLIAASCTAFSYANFNQDFQNGKVTLIGCPKLDGVDYSVKLAEILSNNDIKSITIVRMEVPCCGGLEMAVKNAINQSGKDILLTTSIIGIDGSLRSVNQYE